MAYPFNPARREVFKKTFLRDVFLYISFVPLEDTDLFFERLASFVSERYKKEVLKDDFKQEIGLISDDKTVSLLFSYNRTALRLQYPGYKNFEMVLRMLSSLIDYIRAIRVDTLLSISIIKFNELVFETKKGSNADILNAMHAIFSDNLIGDIDIDSDAVRWEKEKLFKEEDSQVRLTYGFKKDDTDSYKGSLVLKSAISADIHDLDEITRDKLYALNDLLDGAFQWSVNDQVLNSMRQG